MQKRRAQGLCYNCDEKYSWGHKCVEQRLYVLDADLSEDPTVEEVGEPLEVLEEEEEAIMEAAPDQETPPQISLHALAGFTTPQTMKVQGHLKCHQPLVILIDSGSTHNFMDPRVAKQGGCYVYPCNSFEVLIANGGKMSCKGKCCNVKVTMGDYNLKSNMYLLPLGGCDMVLGAQWLRTLGPILWDFRELWMQFTTGGQKYTLNGLQAGPSQVISSHRMEKVLKRGSPGMVAQLFSLQLNDKTEPDIPTDLQQVLQSHATVFSEPTGLPPRRPQDHTIPLLPGSLPPNIRPYRYPHLQKNKIEKLVEEMLQAGVIRPSTSPYSSPVLLVRKKDGSWRMCVYNL